MPYDVEGRALTPLGELVGIVDFPLAEFLPPDAVATVFDSLYFTEAIAWSDGPNLVINIQLLFEGELALKPPATDLIALVFGSAGPGWTAISAEIVIGPDCSIALREATVGLRISPDVLSDVATGAPAEISISADVRFAPSTGIVIENYTGASLDPAYLCGTGIIVEADDVRPIFGLINPPAFLADREDFQGFAFERMAVTIPSEYLQTDPGAELEISISEATIGTTGFTGRVALASADLAHPVAGTFLGFPFRFRTFALDIQQNSILDAALGLDLRLEPLEDGASQKWVGIDVSFGSGGSLSAALSAVQPPEASDDPAVLVNAEFPDVLRLNVAGLRVTRSDDDVWAIYLSGALKILIVGADDWPEIEFDEIGISSEGELLLPEGAGIAFASPLIVNWHFVRLTISKFRLAAAERGGGWLQLGLSAEVMLMDGLPAGGSVEGLIVEFLPDGSQDPTVSFKGIGIAFGVPGAFNAAFYAEFTQSPTGVEFRGQGSLALTALDMGIEIGVIVGYETVPQEFVYLYLFADAKLMPTGIPIGQTGISIYGFQGLLAYNMGLAIDQQLPPDERYYTLFVQNPIGITHVSKWEKQFGQNALGFGIVLGTADKGFALNVKGLLVIAFPDLTILLQAKANILTLKPDLSTQSEGTLDALLVYASGQSTLTLDIVAYWGIPILVEVTGHARAFFSFADPAAWYLEIGRDEDGKRVTAQALQWNDDWLFVAGFWFRLDMEGVVTGVLYELDLRAEKGGFWAEVYGMARGEMALFWQPAQWEGRLAMEGRIAAGYKGVSVGIHLSGHARARAKRPFDVLISVRACVEALLWEVCKRFRFHWEVIEPPQLEAPIRKWTALPRHWTPRQIAANELDMGVVALPPTATSNGVQSHSVIALDFAKSMVDATGIFNEAVALDDDGFQTIGRKSGWAGAWRLDALEVRRDPDGDDEPLEMWGTWARETLQPNTTLRLHSSKRFDHEGSLSESFVDRLDLDYCDPPKRTEICVCLDGLSPGFGVLEDGSLFHWWNPEKPDVKRQPTRKDVCGIWLEPGDRLEIDFLPGVAEVEVVTCAPPGSSPGGSWMERLCTLLNETPFRPVLPGIGALLGIGWLSRGGRKPSPLRTVAVASGSAGLIAFLLRMCKRWHQSSSRTAAVEVSPTSRSGAKASDCGCEGETKFASKTKKGTLVLTSKEVEGRYVCRVCYQPGHGTPNWADISRRGGSSTPNEEWFVPTEMKLLPPNELFELRVTWTAQLKDPEGAVSEPLGTKTTIARFRTPEPPSYPDALDAYITGFYPDDGARPVYLGYDLSVTFVEDYVPYLYAAVGERLVFRLFDGQGRPVVNTSGQPLLVPATAIGPVEQSVSGQHWEEIRRRNVDRGCLAPAAIPHTGQTVLSTAASEWELTPNSQYVGHLVSDSRPEVPLARWGFTTSRFATFTTLTTTGRTLLPARRAAMALPSAGDFDALARAAAVPTIVFVEIFSVTPLLAPDGMSCLALLFESPEPLDFVSRLTVTVDGSPTTLTPNADGTRGFVRPQAAAGWAIAVVTVSLTWRRDSTPRLTVAGDATAEVVTFDVNLVAGP
jgi:hypothetical protein